MFVPSFVTACRTCVCDLCVCLRLSGLFACTFKFGLDLCVFLNSGSCAGKAAPRPGGMSAKALKEIQSAQRLCLECEQVIENCQSAFAWETMTVKQAAVLLERLKGKLTPTLISMRLGRHEAFPK